MPFGFSMLKRQCCYFLIMETCLTPLSGCMLLYNKAWVKWRESYFGKKFPHTKIGIVVWDFCCYVYRSAKVAIPRSEYQRIYSWEYSCERHSECVWLTNRSLIMNRGRIKKILLPFIVKHTLLSLICASIIFIVFLMFKLVSTLVKEITLMSDHHHQLTTEQGSIVETILMNNTL